MYSSQLLANGDIIVFQDNGHCLVISEDGDRIYEDDLKGNDGFTIFDSEVIDNGILVIGLQNGKVSTIKNPSSKFDHIQGPKWENLGKHSNRVTTIEQYQPNRVFIGQTGEYWMTFTIRDNQDLIFGKKGEIRDSGYIVSADNMGSNLLFVTTQWGWWYVLDMENQNPIVRSGGQFGTSENKRGVLMGHYGIIISYTTKGANHTDLTVVNPYNGESYKQQDVYGSHLPFDMIVTHDNQLLITNGGDPTSGKWDGVLETF